jgi:DNA-binding response OmpR family regulator
MSGKLPLILLVDDDPVFRNRLMDALVQRGYPVVCAVSVRTGVEALASNPDFLLLDMLLPEGNGVEVLREARRRSMPLTSLVITVAGDQARLLSEMAVYEPDGVMVKPVELDAVVSWIEARQSVTPR